jgi:ribonuclease BN (tRNA processing enzyme)
MRLTILGSGTNMHPRRAAAGYLIETDRPFLLDLGPRTLANLLTTRVDRHRITHLLFSHFHADHFSDFITFYFDAVTYSKLVRRRPDLTLIGPRGSRKLFRTIIKTFPVFSEAPFRTRIEEVCDETFCVGATRITAQSVRHTPRLHCLGYRMEYRGRSVVYSGDSVLCDELVSLCGRSDVAVLDCSYPSNRPGPAHMHAGDCGRVAREAQVGRLLLSHFYMDAERFDVTRQAGKHFDGEIARAEDLMRVTW